MTHLPPDAALWREIEPDARWSASDFLLGQLVRLTATANWQRGGKGARPTIVLPWEKSDEDTVKGDVMTLEQARDWLGW